jgi:hypothetical protein
MHHQSKKRTTHGWVALPLGAIGLLLMVAVVGTAGAAKPKRHAFTEHVIAASITADGSQSVAKIQDSVDGPGAGTTRSSSTSTAYPLTGTDTNIAYFANGVGRSIDTFRLEKPNPKGISKFSATGRCTGGTRAHKGAKCSFTESGTVDTSPGGVARIKVVGTYTK